MNMSTNSEGSMDAETFRNRALIGGLMRSDYAENPPDVDEWVRALEGCAELYRHAAAHLADRPPRFAEAARIIALAVKTASVIHTETALAYALSGQATDDFMEQMRESMRDDEGEHP